MVIGKKLYLGKSITNKFTLLWKLKHGFFSSNFYVISLSMGDDQLACTPCFYLKQKGIREALGEVVGIARNYSEMLEVIIKMMEDSLSETGSANIKDYLKRRERSG